MKIADIDKYIGNRFKEERTKRNLTMEDIAKLANLKGKQSYRSYEIGRTSMPLPVYKKICSLFGINYSELFKEAQMHMIEKMTNDINYIEKQYSRKNGKI